MNDLVSNEIMNEPWMRHNIKLISVCRNQFFMGNIYIVVVLIINHCDDSSGVIWLHLFEATMQIQSPIYNPPDIQMRDSFKNQFTFFSICKIGFPISFFLLSKYQNGRG